MTNDKNGLEGTPLEPAGTTEEETRSVDQAAGVEQPDPESPDLAGTAIGSDNDTGGGTAAENPAVEVTSQQPTELASADAEAAAQEGETQAEVSEGPAAPERVEAGGHVDYSRTFRSLAEGDVVDGVVVHIDKEGVLVDVGTKSEGIIRPNELASGPVPSLGEVVSLGDKIDVYVMEPENRDGNLILSKKRADFEKAWERLQHAHEEGKVITAMVTDRVKGGLVADLGIRGFVPASHVGNGKVRNLERYVGQSLPLKVIEVDRNRRKVVLSHRLAIEQERAKQREATLTSLAEGQIRPGIVRRITDYGAFVDLGGLDGLLHISEMSWSRIKHPSEVVNVGQKIDVVVLRLNLEAGRVSLGLRQILPDPWTEVEDKYSVGQTIRGTVSRLVPFGAFVQLDEGIEGIIPNPELSRRRVNRPEDVVSVGQEVEAKIIDIKPEERRMTLSFRQIQEDEERGEYESYKTSRSERQTTLGELVGPQLKRFRSSKPQAEPAEDEAPVEMAAPEEEPAAGEVATVTDESAEAQAPAEDEALVEVATPEEEPAAGEAVTVTEKTADAQAPAEEEAPVEMASPEEEPAAGEAVTVTEEAPEAHEAAKDEAPVVEEARAETVEAKPKKSSAKPAASPKAKRVKRTRKPAEAKSKSKKATKS